MDIARKKIVDCGPSLSLSSLSLDMNAFSSLLPLIASKGVSCLILRDNSLTSLPSSMADLGELTTLDISSNPIENVVDLANVASTIPNLRALSVDVDEEEAVALPLLIPSLTVLNGSTVGAAAVRRNSAISRSQSKPAQPAVSTNIGLTQVEDLFNMIKLLHGNGRRLDGKDEAKMDKAFHDHADAVFTRLRGSLSKLEEDFERKAETLMAKHGLYDVCFQEVISYTEKVNPDLCRVFRKIRSAHTSMFQAFPPIVGEARDFNRSVLEEVRAESAREIDRLGAENAKETERIRANSVREIDMLRADLSRSEMETNQLLEAAELLEEEVKNKAAEVDRLNRALKSTKMENVALKDQITGLSQLEGGGSRKAFILRGGNGRRGDLTFKNSSERKQERSRPQESKQEDLQDSVLPPPPKQSSAENEGDLTIRNISLNHLLSFMDELYASKTKYDQKCAESKKARETMEQHMYTFLNQRYGLRSLIVENASAVIKAVNLYSLENTDVAVFGKIIRNEVDEEFRFVVDQLKESMMSLLHVSLKARNPNKPEDHIVKISNSITSSTIPVSVSSDIVGYLYNEEDTETLRKMLDDEAKRVGGVQDRRKAEQDVAKGTPRVKDKERTTEKAIPYKLFEKVLMDFQLLGHDRFLSKFRECFNRLDGDKDGILDEDQFTTLCSLVGKPTTKGKNKIKERTEEELGRFLSIADPFNHSSVTFSSAVACMSEDIVEMVVDMHERQRKRMENESKREGSAVKNKVGDRMKRLVSL